jgi:hypothetical protein
MNWIWLLVCFAFGLFVGYMLCDVITSEVKYVIGRMKNKRSPGANIGVDLSDMKTPRDIRIERRQTRRERRKTE